MQPDVVHLNGYAHGGAAVERAGGRRRPLVRVLVVDGGARRRRRRASWDAYRARGARRAARRRRLSSRRRAAMLRALSAHYGAVAGTVVPNGAHAAQLQRRRRRSRSSSAPGGCGTRRRTSTALASSRRACPWPVTLAGETRATAAPRRALHARRVPRAPAVGGAARRGWRAPRSTRCRRATSRSACRCSRRRCRAARWCSATSRACASIWDDAARVRRRPTITTRCARALQRLIDDPARRARARPRARGRARREFTRRAHGRRLSRALYDGAARDAASAARRWRSRRARRDLLPLAALRLEPRQRALPARRRAPSCSRAATTSRVYEPRDALEPSRTSSREHGEAPLDGVRSAPIPTLAQHALRPRDARPRRGARRRRPRARPRVERARARRARSARTARRAARYVLLFHDTHHRVGHRPGRDGRATTCAHYDGVLAFGDVIRDALPRARLGGARVDVARGRRHAASSARVPARAREGDLVWIGNWGDDERTAELHEFLIEPVRALGLRGAGPRRALSGATRAQRSRAAGIEYGGWLPNYEVPRRRSRASRHGPRAAAALRRGAAGHPDHPPVRGAGLRHPAGLRALGRREGLFTPGEDYLVAADGAEMTRQLARAARRSGARARGSPTTGARTILGAPHLRAPRRRAARDRAATLARHRRPRHRRSSESVA